MNESLASHPVLTCAEAVALEQRILGDDEEKAWGAMTRAGRAIAASVLRDFEEIGGFPPEGRVLVLVGKGHNGGDALLATRVILEQAITARAEVRLVFGDRSLRPLAHRAYLELVHAAGSRVTMCRKIPPGDAGEFALCVDGILGFQFRPPVDERVAALLAQVNALPIRLRAAVDLPSGLGEETKAGEPVFRADFTYATGSVKVPVINGANAENVGRLRYLDLGFFQHDAPEARLHVLTPQVLAPLARLRSATSEKRMHGHLFVLGGSRNYAGAVMMTVLAALRSGAGLVTAFVPEALAAAFAAQVPEAIWVGWPGTPGGGLALEGQHLLQNRLERAKALVIGPGLGSEAETLTLVTDIVKTSPVPLVLDADALQPQIVRSGSVPRILTPHLGELRRILVGNDFYESEGAQQAIMVVKGRLTAITQAGRSGYYSPFGGPVLARGGSGDLLAGITGRLLAETPGEPLLAACRGVTWHGLAADALARKYGQVAVRTTQLLDFLPEVLREL